jgi:opacity protein-like surface antigen
MNRFAIGAVTFVLLASSWQANASVPLGGNRKGAGGSYDMYGCMQTNDYYVVNFAAYQSASSLTKDSKTLPEAECIDLPMTGKTQITLDLLDRDVRKKQVGLKILREDGQIISELPMAVAKQGVISTSVDFKAAGKYQAVLYVNDTDLNTPPETSALHIPLTVALVTEPSTGQNSMLLFFIGIGTLITALAYFMPRLLKPRPAESAP